MLYNKHLHYADYHPYVRGIKTRKKLLDFQTYYNNSNSDILLIQETHDHSFDWLESEHVLSLGTSNSN